MPEVIPWRGIVAAALAAFATLALAAEPFQGRVVSVADGDTVTVLDQAQQQHHIRISGIDAPEKRQPFGQRSKASMADQVFDQVVTVEPHKTDRYGRTVALVRGFNGEDVGLNQIRRGLAWHYVRYAKEQPAPERAAYAEAEKEARAARRGLWSEPDPVAPWDFRHPKTKQEEP